jgi:competence protein ComEC
VFKYFLLSATIVMFHNPTATIAKDKIIFWNVGQGSWTTLVTNKNCIHVDAGGRHRSLSKECYYRKNYLWFTHYDWDHIGLAKKIFLTASKTCLMQPLPATLSPFKKKFLHDIPVCPKTTEKNIHVIYKSNFLINNDSSAFVLGKQVLITGDASQKMEKTWLGKLPANSIHTLLAGHHGSRTSLSTALLKKLKNLRMVIVSAEKKKYGHPHNETVEKLRRARIPMIKTEDFGSVALEL